MKEKTHLEKLKGNDEYALDELDKKMHKFIWENVPQKSVLWGRYNYFQGKWKAKNEYIEAILKDKPKNPFKKHSRSYDIFESALETWEFRIKKGLK